MVKPMKNSMRSRRLNVEAVADMDLAIGTHLVTNRLWYTHHGVYAGAGKVVHYAGLSRSLRRGPVHEVTLAEFAHGHPVWVRQSPGARFAGAEAVQRAYSRIGEDRYRLISNNCEHFCTWCLYGESRSEQIDVWRFRASDVVAAGIRVVRLFTVATSLSVSALRAVSRFGFEGQIFANSTQSTS
ncbi:lecithin retinol acyltransferase family protein [Cupriavidus sp. AcVe19-6a]|nr:lecithin retinol acyltransferase family protein [Cupriavidus sp. AcVe19-6a]